MSSYHDAIRYLLSLGNEVKTAKLGLERIAKLLNELGRPEHSFQSVHIAGTNGKGSTAAMIESAVRAAGFRTGLYTSPHLVRINERIRIGGQEVSDADFTGSFQVVHAAIEKLLATGDLEIHPTYFEFVTAMAFWTFREAGIDYAVVEVGLGGRLDATNVLRPRAAVITPIDFDHEAFLGRTAGNIAAEKAGILKPETPAVFAPQRPEAAEVLEARATELQVPVVRVGKDWRAEQVDPSNGCYHFLAVHRSGLRIPIELGLAGEHQVINALVAIATLDLLGVEAPAIERGLREARWPGRLETVAKTPVVLLDGAHNPAGARALTRHLERHYPGRRVWLIYAAMRDKAVDEVAGILFPAAYRVLLTQVSQRRAVSVQTLHAIVAHHHSSIEVTESLAEALHRARASASPADIIVVTGSLFLVGEAKTLACMIDD